MTIIESYEHAFFEILSETKEQLDFETTLPQKCV